MKNMHPCLSYDNIEETKMDISNISQQEFSETQVCETICRRKTRRGKKKNRNLSRLENGGCCQENEIDSCNQCSTLMEECDYIHEKMTRKSGRKRTGRLLRPRYSPKAPRNYTSFIMDDHLENAYGYLDYKSPESNFDQRVDDGWSVSPDYFSRLGSSDNVDFCDEDIENENLDCAKTLDFIKNDFEFTYNSSRTEELSKLTKDDLIVAIRKMEDHAEQLSKNLDNVELQDKSPRLSMERNIRNLQNENKKLQIENEALKAVLCPHQSDL
ncbi:Hypothetical predicted protein [Mytilus galloprovincialis]|uniref:Uncharacterized protein n=2 Tax=Mytilus galloprovincialis TaxID=29158 RepID=A0A8B6FG28_MYTGA|nr:Hypothetical predicted protein [Mytilus galloprovincialis]